MKELETKLIAWQKTALVQPYFSFVQKLFLQFSEAEIYLVGGAVRDLIIGRETKDFDFVIRKVSAKDLEKFLSENGKVNLVGKSFGVFKFVPNDSEEQAEAIDIALPRTEHAGMSGGYKDFEIQSDKDLPIQEDLSRRDFTINALAWDLKNKKLVDEFNGIKDLKEKTIKAIGDPATRFQEDYTRMLRAIRFSCQLDFMIEGNTLISIKDKAAKIATIPGERIGEEFSKIIMSDRAEDGVRLMQQIGLLKILIPELDKGVGVGQNKEHIYEVFEHNVRALGAAAQHKFKLEVRLAALFHDIGKVAAKEGDGPTSTFYNHDQIGANLTKSALKKLSFSNDVINYVVHLVRYHMFYYALDTVTDSGVRRLLNRLGKENIEDFINLRICDRLGMGRPKGKPWKLIQLEKRFQEVQLDPITPKMLALNGTELMELLSIDPGPMVGLILNALLGEVLDDPKRNDKDYLSGRAKELYLLPAEELRKLNPDVQFYEEERKRMLHSENKK